MESSLETLALLGASLGVLSHVGHFIHGENTLKAPLYAAAAIIGPPTVTIMLTYLARLTASRAIQVTAAGYTTYVGALFMSMLVYRVYFHPLRQFPGPGLAQFTQFYHFFKVKDKVDNFRHLARLHAQYGDYVRVGPNLLSVADPDIVDSMFSPQTKFEKADWYDIGYPVTNLAQIRDKEWHERRRRHGWNQAFSASSLRAYDSRVIKYADILIAQIDRKSGAAVDAARWFEWFSFDVMGGLVFGRGFRAIETGQSHTYIDTMHETSPFPLSCLGTMPWVIQVIGAMVPNRLNSFMKLVWYSTDCMEEQKRRIPVEPNIMTPILEAGPFFGKPEQDDLLLVGDARLLIIAGSDTASTTITYAFYNLARDPSLVLKLREELEAHHIRNDEHFTVQKLQHLDFLNAFINETLRLHPPVPGGTFRNTPKEGVLIGGQSLPGGVRVIAPQYLIQRSPRAFKYPDEFIPERWTTRNELITNKKAWFPFSAGKFACIGKQLALNEIRTVVAKMVLEFNVFFAEGETGKALLEESQDISTLVMAGLKLCFVKRR